MATPCENLGYEEGMKFIVVNDDIDGLTAGDALWLHYDDGSDNPGFRDTEKVNDDTETFYIDLGCVARYSSDHTLAYMHGFREGDILQVVMYDAAEGAKEGDIITFINDDGDTCPKFRLHKDNSEPYLYLSHVGSLEPKLGRKVRIIHNCTGGFSSGTEGIIVDICSDGDYQIEAYGDTMYHHSSSCVVYGYAEDESSEKGSEPVKEDYPTKPASEWTKGDKGIVRGQQEIDPHNFQIGEVITFNHKRDSERGIFTGTRYTSTQNIQYDLIEVITGIEPYQITVTKVSKDNPVACIKAIRTATGCGLYEAKQAYDFVRDNEEPYSLIVIISKEELTKFFNDAPIQFFFGEESKPSGTKASEIICDELSPKKYKYFIDGDSIEVELVGYFDGEPICAYKDRWGDIQTFVAKPSLLVEE